MWNPHDTAGQRLRADHQRYTSGRRVIVEALADSDGPLSIAEILDACSGLAQSSAYRNLAVLERAGVVRRFVTRDDFARYELAEELTEHHHHLVCEACGRVEDFTMPDTLESDLEACLSTVAAKYGFRGLDHQLDLMGTCARCRG